jgi:ParB-like chromosome segregation protein Spo0J
MNTQQHPIGIAAAVAAAPKSNNGPGVVKKSGGAWNVDPSTIVIEPGWNIRFDLGNIDELAASIAAHQERDPESGGLIHPLGLRRIDAKDPLSEGGKFHFAVVRGHRRTTAIAQLLKKGIEFPYGVPAKILEKNLSFMDAMLEMFIENGQKPLLPLEEAAAFKRLQEGDPSADPVVPGLTIAEISKATGRSDHHIISTLALLDADESVIAGLKDGSLGKTTARAIAKDARGDKAKQKELVALAKSSKKKTAVKDALHAAKQAKAAKKGKTLKMRALSDAQLSELGAKVAADVVVKLKEASKKPDFDVEGWIKKDEDLVLAFTYGALQSLKAAAGAKVNLSL